MKPETIINMTLEEKAERYLSELPNNDHLTTIDVMVGFAREIAKAKLEQAAEKTKKL